jgi:KDO2-lipid IV(A) lauroyltransferase
MPSDNFWTTKFAALRYSVAWLGYAWMLLVVRLPRPAQTAVGRGLGRLGYAVLRERRRIAARNIDTCLAHLPPDERAAILERHFEALGLSLVEMAVGWFGRPEAVRQRVDVEGAEHLEAALAKGRGVILFSAHFTTFEFFWPALRPLCTKLCGMYKWQRNPVMNRIMNRGRSRYYDSLFAKDNVRKLMRCLRENSVVWYASDQSYGGKGSVLIPFFGEPAMTNTAIGRIARTSGAAVLPYFCRRLPNDRYVMSIGAPLDGLPSGDDVADTRALTKRLEDYIRLCPEQYWWIHQRFKGRPAPLPDLYAAPAR